MTKVLAVHDLSCLGGASLTTVIPVMSSFGLCVCPVPSALLSNHTGYEEYTYLDLSFEMEKIFKIYDNMGKAFNAVTTGFLGSCGQIDILLPFVKKQKERGALILIDPVMADGGRYYHTFDDKMAAGMRKLASVSDLLTPNLTECCFLLGETYTESPTDEKIKEYLSALGRLGPSKVVITGISRQGEIACAGYDKSSDETVLITHPRLEAHFTGTGDLFGSLLLSHTLTGEGFFEAISRSAQGCYNSIKKAIELNFPRLEGIPNELMLSEFKALETPDIKLNEI